MFLATQKILLFSAKSLRLYAMYSQHFPFWALLRWG
jgi:hypothetical protein